MIKARKEVSKLTIERMAVYYNTLMKMKEEEGVEICASTQLGENTGIASSVIRRDLACFGGFGRKGVGYDVDFLLSWIQEILGYNTEWNVLLVGIDIPVTGIVSYYSFLPPGFKITAVIDLDKNNRGYTFPAYNLAIQPLENLKTVIKKQDIAIGFINVPPKQAQKVVTMMVKAGIRGIANFSSVPVAVPEHVFLSQVNVASCLSQLSYSLRTGIADGYL
ncbi:redox-sensing transcriptional repressor Rex [Sporomusa acidovorans]|uniref:Redox-sensing transcriptional repressor Rex n=1 Tax=Sporomusa acidovorans (strain ATCC 49682 / DSM 3132 / Mol) TaxID=1123286 RepID=A0ABZ3IXY4_SPOA4|nr:redox-sensing transcriptional repressor Rex [Sporomusa acidovorans]OZC22203.1 redox-sensing transcriptional repressor Rex [Sporomusa acidovorans DSM 3132]SDE81651.1 redox-sensing transcriptional repressor [Sporomusa acidovorans]